MKIAVSEVSFTSASREERRTGLLGWVAVVINGALKIDGLTVRQTREGRLALSFPARRDRQDRVHFVVRPISDEARRTIERQVLAQLAPEVVRG